MVLCVLTDPLFLSAFWPYLEHTWYSVLVHVPGTQMVFVVVLDTDPGVHSSVVRAADCRSAGPWFNSGWRSWFSFVTGSDNLTKQTAQRNNVMSPITTITSKSVKNFAFRAGRCNFSVIKMYLKKVIFQ